jgi:uncharacterized membrane protein
MASSTACAAPAAPLAGPLFERVLLPHRSLPLRRFHLLMAVLGVISCGVGTVFVALGAWPVTGFFGLDIGLVYLAFRVSYRRARRREVLRLAGDAFTVERINLRGNRCIWRFQPFWMRVVLDERDPDRNRLFIASHGRALAIGDFLAPAARRELAETIGDALARWRAAIGPEPTG